MSRAMAYKMKMLSGGDSHQEKVEQGFCDAFQKGYSVVEIARSAGLRSAKFVHTILVKKDQIGKAQRGRQSSKIMLPDAFAGFLKVREISFAQWCAGWAFNPVEAAAGVAALDGIYGVAVKRDFPRYYSKVMGSDMGDLDFESGPEYGPKASFDIHVDWDGILGCYSAEIKELDLLVYGDSERSAIHLLLIRRNQLMSLKRLESLPDLNGAGVDMTGFDDW